MKHFGYIETAGIDKARILLALWQGAKQTNRGVQSLELEDCEAYLQEQTYFDVFFGKILKISLADDGFIKPRLYDIYNGQDAAKKALSNLLNRSES